MDVEQAALVCAAFDLGMPLNAPIAVRGGRLHRLWRLDTTHGHYAVKQLNPTLLNAPDARERYVATERIAAAMAAAGLPAVAALTGPNGPLCDVVGATVLVYPWIVGETLPPAPADPVRARQIGELLARVHALGLRADGILALTWETQDLPDDGWVLLARRGIAQGRPWGEPLRALRHDLALWHARVRPAIAELYRVQVLGHRDLDQRNVLWRARSSPALIDWETAGMTHPTVELADAALNWSGITVGPPDEAAFGAVVAGYRAAGGALHGDSRDVLYTVLDSWLGWLRYNLRRSLGELGAGPEEQDMAVREAETTLAAAQALGASVDLWASWLESR